MNNIKEYILQQLRDSDPSLDLQPGSALHDLLVNSVAVIVGGFKNLQDKMLSYQTLENPESIPTDSLDSFGKSYLVDRTLGGAAAGYVKLFFDSPVSLSIPTGTIFESDTGKQYKTLRPYSFAEEDMRTNTYGVYYATGDIYVQALNDGIDYNTGAGTITKLLSNLNVTPIFVKNLLAISGGSKTDSNLELYSKIVNSAINKNLFSDDGIKSVLEDAYSTATVMKIAGMRDPEMTRDLVYSGYYYTLYNKSDYYGAMGDMAGPNTATIPSGAYIFDGVSGYLASGEIVSGIVSWSHYYPFNQSAIYYAPVAVSGVAALTAADMPTLAEFNNEFSMEQYSNLYKHGDTYFATVATQIILDEDFTDSIIEHRGWQRSDASTGPGIMVHGKEIETVSGVLRLGYNPNIGGPLTPTITVTSGLREQIYRLIKRANYLPRGND
jgi:hypothetical protein